MQQPLSDPRQYPIGKFQPKENYSFSEIKQLITTIAAAPAKYESAYHLLKDRKLDLPYREGGWTARQVMHHVVDSHMNAYIRFKWTLTENKPTIKAYNEKAWAETYEVKHDPSISIALLKALHAKWVVLLNDLTEADLQKSFIHPETGKEIALDRLIAMYAWHSEHHLAHLQLIING